MEKQSLLDRILTFILYLSAICLGIYLLSIAGSVIKEKILDQKEGAWERLYLQLQDHAISACMPEASYEADEEHVTGKEWFLEKVLEQIPFFLREQENASAMVRVESSGLYEQIAGENSRFLQEQIRVENMEAGPEEENLENTGGITMESVMEEPQDIRLNDLTDNTVPVAEAVPLEKFQDYDFVINNYFTVDQTTTLSSEQLHAADWVVKDLRMATTADQPQILIYHTHSQEAFIDSRPGEVADTIVGIGEYLTALLRENYGYHVIHLTDVFDVVDGSLDRSGAYTVARDRISQILEENPSIEVVIDLHRDGVPEDRHLVTDINGKQTAQIMFFNGLSRTTKSGEITSLPNPYIEDNLAFSLQLHLMADQYYPGLARTIYLKGYRYNMHMRPKSLLIECGAQTNTLEEEKNAMEPLADILHKVLKGE